MLAELDRAPHRRTTTASIAGCVLVGAALTAFGWFGAPTHTWGCPEHVKVFLYLWLFLAALQAITGVGSLGIGCFAGAAIAVITGNVAGMFAVLLLAWSATALGHHLLTRWRAATVTDSLLVGLVAFGTAIGLLVHLRVNYPAVYLGLLLLPIAVAPRAAIAILGRARAVAGARAAPGPLSLATGAAAAALACVHLLVALMPERGHDALVTHLLLPARIAWDHVWAFDVDRYVWAVMPMLGDWLYTIGYMLGGEVGARLVNFTCILLLGRLVCDLVAWAGGGPSAARIALLLYLSTPLTLTATSSLFIESVWGCMLVGGALALLRDAAPAATESTSAGQHAVVGGILLGGALAAKAVTMVVAPVLLLVPLVRWRRWSNRTGAPALIAGLAGLVAVGAVPYVRAYLLTGNPVFPFYNGYFRSPHYWPTTIEPPPRFAHGATWDVLYRMTFHSGDYLEAMPGAAGFQWLLLLLPAVAASALQRARRPLVLLALAAACVWLIFGQTAYLRYVFPCFAIGTAAIAVAIDGATVGHVGGAPRGRPLAGRPARWLLLAATGTAVTLNLVCIASGGFYGDLSLRVLLNPAARDAWLTVHAPMRQAVALVNGLNQSRAPVALFGSSCATDLHADPLFPNWYNHRFLADVQAARTAEDLGRLLGREHVRYVILAHDWEDENARQLVRAVSDEVQTTGRASVRRVHDRFVFTAELLQNPTFCSAIGWQSSGNTSLTAGCGATLGADGQVAQRLAVREGTEYLLSATVRRATAEAVAEAVLRIDWLDAGERLLQSDVHVIDCGAEADTHAFITRAPIDAVTAIVCGAGSRASLVVIERLSLQH